MRDLKTVLESYGADYGTTMERFLDNEGMYIRILDMLFQDENLQNLGEALAQQDYTAAFEAAHTLKGVAGNLGLTPLYQAVCQIVEPLRARNQEADYSSFYQNIKLEFRKVEDLRLQLREGESYER